MIGAQNRIPTMAAFFRRAAMPAIQIRRFLEASRSNRQKPWVSDSCMCFLWDASACASHILSCAATAHKTEQRDAHSLTCHWTRFPDGCQTSKRTRNNSQIDSRGLYVDVACDKLSLHMQVRVPLPTDGSFQAHSASGNSQSLTGTCSC